MADLKSGDVVVLKSGSPEMTVQYVDTALDNVMCKWFVGDKVVKETFSSESLELAEEED